MEAFLNNFYTVGLDGINRAEALRYLSGGDTPDEKLSALMDKCEKKLLNAISGKFTYRVFGIKSIAENTVILDNCALVMTGRDICAHLSGCRSAALMCATIGGEADRLIRTEQISDMAAAVITDAMASCAVEQVCDKAEEIIRGENPGMFMTWRFSAGYGDFPLSVQRLFLDVTDAGRSIGLFANENSVLTPKKSVTAVIGLSDMPIENKRRGCASCRMKNDCIFRKKGSRCTDD